RHLDWHNGFRVTAFGGVAGHGDVQRYVLVVLRRVELLALHFARVAEGVEQLGRILVVGRVREVFRDTLRITTAEQESRGDEAEDQEQRHDEHARAGEADDQTGLLLRRLAVRA